MKELIERVGPAVRNGVYSVLKRYDRDCEQSAYLKIIKYEGMFAGRCDFKTWCYKVARSVVFDSFRRERPAESIDDYLFLKVGPRFSAERLDLERAIPTLTAGEQEILSEFLQGYTYEEIARHRGLAGKQSIGPRMLVIRRKLMNKLNGAATSQPG